MSSAVAPPDFALAPAFGLPAFLAPASSTHAVQFYERESFLFDAVGKFLAAGLLAKERIFVVASPEHVEGFVERVDPRELDRARDEKRITVLDARASLSQFMVDDMPDARLFREFVGRLMESNGASVQRTRVRAYGEMVDLLAKEGNLAAAVRLEELWDDALQQIPGCLLCGYLMGSFSRSGDGERLREIFGRHSHVIPTESYVGLSDPEQRLREITLLQQRERMLATEMERRRKLERALEAALGDLSLAEELLTASMKREQTTRLNAESTDAARDGLLGMLGHDLRNPLNTILTTVRMMARRNELGAESRARLERVVASSVRMHRMIEQLLDLAEARQPGGIQVRLSEPRELAPLVTAVVDEVRATSPSRTIELVTRPCSGRVDVERFQQALWTVLSFVVTHSAASDPVRVEVSPRDDGSVITVQTPCSIDKRALLSALLDSSHVKPDTEFDALTVGLHVAHCIALAHGGRIEARSSPETGTTFEARLPPR